jgi:hypothetical protein
MGLRECAMMPGPRFYVSYVNGIHVNNRFWSYHARQAVVRDAHGVIEDQHCPSGGADSSSWAWGSARRQSEEWEAAEAKRIREANKTHKEKRCVS